MSENPHQSTYTHTYGQDSQGNSIVAEEKEKLCCKQLKAVGGDVVVDCVEDGVEEYFQRTISTGTGENKDDVFGLWGK